MIKIIKTGHRFLLAWPTSWFMYCRTERTSKYIKGFERQVSHRGGNYRYRKGKD